MNFLNMKNKAIAILALALLALPLAAQTATAPAVPTTAAAAATYPSYFVTMGGGYTRNATPQAAEGFLSTAVGLGGGNYSVTTIDMTSTASTIRTGFAKIFSQSGNFSLLGRVDAGISTVAPVIGSFSGGGIVMYNLKGIKPSLAGTFLSFEVRITGASTVTAAAPNQVTPGFFFGFGRSF